MRATKRKSRGLRLKLVSAAVMSCFASAALANPNNPSTVHGAVSYGGLGTNSVTVTNAGGTNAVIEWQGFSIGVGELTRFQQFSNLAVLNRVTGPDISSILGTLRSDGRVFLINQNGIFIGGDALLDLPGFVASSLDIDNGDFLAGRMNFKETPGAGTVENQADIFTPPGGSVYLVGHAVTNGGLISTPQGEVVLAAGESVEIVNPGTPGLSVVMNAPANEALNMGQILADSGQVGMFGGLVTQRGTVNAGGAVVGPNGTIKLVATDKTTFDSGSNTTGGGLNVDTGDLVVAGSVITGEQDVHAGGGVVVQNGQLSATGGQSIDAENVEVTSSGGFAAILNNLGEQSIVTRGANAQGEGIAVRGTAGGFAFLDSTAGNQRIELRNSDRLTVDGSSGHAQMFVVDGEQTITVTGGGANAIELGASGGGGGSFITSGGSQTLVAGGPGEQGSITTQGANARISTLPGTGGAQTISATGTVAVLGGSSPGGSSAGFFHNGSGVQTIQAGGLALQGGANGTNNSAQVNSAIGPQAIDVGSLSVSGGSAGTNNFAFVRAQGAPQAIHAGTLTLQAGPGGTSNFAAILGAQQTIMVDGDATISGGASLSTPTLGGGALIGGGTSLPTDLVLTAGGSVTLNGGAIPGSGASLGASNAGVQRTDITVQAGGDVRMNPGTGTGTRMGAGPGNSLGGAIQVSAGGEIYLGSNNIVDGAVMRTAEGVTLDAQKITQDPDARIEAASLTVHAQQGALLGGMNTVDQFSAVNDWFGDVTLRNASPLLTLTSLQNFGGGFNLQQTGDALVNGFAFSGPQAVDVAGTLTVRPGAAGPAQLIGNGGQTVTANGIVVEGGAAGVASSAAIVAGSGAQAISAGAGGITVRGGAAGTNNFAMIHQGDSLASQTVTSAGPVLLEGGSGTFNFALIRSFGTNQSLTFGDTAVLAGAGGVDNFATVQGLHQDMTVHGDLSIAARGSLGTPAAGGGARIGGLGGIFSSATDLTLQVDGSLTMTAGDVPSTGVSLGGHLAGDQPAGIAVSADGDITLSGGTASGTFARVGSADSGATGGIIDIAAGGAIALNSAAPDRASIIRTLDDVRLSAQSITQGPDASIEAGSLSVNTHEGASLAGANAVSQFNAINNLFGDITLHNTSPLLTVTGVQNFNGGLTLQQTGDLLVSGFVFSGVQSIDVSGGLIVQSDPGAFAELQAQGGQTIEADYVEVNGQAGGGASIFNSGGSQSIATSSANASGESLALRGTEGGFTSVSTFGGTQSILLTGSGPNALVMQTTGGPAGPGSAVISGDTQTIVAGNLGQVGSIALYGPLSQIISGSVPGGTQTVSTSGTLSLIGSATESSQFPAGIFAQGALQTVSADAIVLQGGSAPGGNSATITAFNGSQWIEAGAGGIVLRGGAAGANNFVQINQASTNPAFTQTVTSAGPVLLEGGNGNFNFAMIRAFGGHQGLELGDTTVLSGATGVDNFSVIQARNQDMTVHGDLQLRAGGSSLGRAGGGVRIGGLGGGAPTPTSLRLDVDGDFTMTGGDLAGAGATLGNAPNFAGNTDIEMNAGGDIVMNGGSVPGTFATIGQRQGLGGGGDIELVANGAIALNSTSPDQASIIRTADNVSLTAQRITQGEHARIEAGSLSVQTAEGASLIGANSVNQLAMQNTVAGAVDFRNASALLTVTGIDQVPGGALNLEQDGNLLIAGDVRSGAQTVRAAGDMTIAARDGRGVTVEANGGQTFRVGGAFSLLGGTEDRGYAQTRASGPVTVTTGGDLNVRGGDGRLAYALMYGGEGIRLTVGGQLHVDGGSGRLAFARVQTDFWDRIFLTFPNASGGSYFVDGREGASSHGLNGFFNGLVPARPGRGLILSYGL